MAFNIYNDQENIPLDGRHNQQVGAKRMGHHQLPAKSALDIAAAAVPKLIASQPHLLRTAENNPGGYPPLVGQRRAVLGEISNNTGGGLKVNSTAAGQAGGLKVNSTAAGQTGGLKVNSGYGGGGGIKMNNVAMASFGVGASSHTFSSGSMGSFQSGTNSMNAAPKMRQGGSFSIHQDGNSQLVKPSAFTFISNSVKPSTTIYEDKENQPPQPQIQKPRRGGGEGLRIQQSLKGQLSPSFHLPPSLLQTDSHVEAMNVSSINSSPLKEETEEPRIGQLKQRVSLRLRKESYREEPEGEDQEDEEDGGATPMLLSAAQAEPKSGSGTCGKKTSSWRVPPIPHSTVDILTEPEYFQDIYDYLRESEEKHRPKWNYMSKQTDITHPMRSILVDWLVEVGEEYNLQTETLYLAVAYLDRFLSLMAVQRSKLQLVGTACMFIAAKYEEIYPPDVSEFVYITDDTYNKRQVLRMEHLVLKVLNFDLSLPTTNWFVHHMCQMVKRECDEDKRICLLALYLSELALVDGEKFLRYPPSLVAATSIALARHTLDLSPWPQALCEGTDYQITDLEECLFEMFTSFSKAYQDVLKQENVSGEETDSGTSSSSKAVRAKYISSKNLSVAKIKPQPLND